MRKRKQGTGRLQRQEGIDPWRLLSKCLYNLKGEIGMEGILKVTPEKLIQTSGEFAGTGGQMKNLTGEMMSLVQWLKG